MAEAYKVLLVDDEQVSRDYIRSFPIWGGGRFQLAAEAAGAREALQILEREPVDIVILDVFMPGMDGVTLSGEIARRHPHTDMLAVSSYDDYDYVREILRNGADDYILKHRLDGGTLARALETVARRREGGRESGGGRLGALRAALRDWLLGEGVCPFSRPGGRLAVTLLRTEPLERHPRQDRDAIVQGVMDILEGSVETGGAATAFYREPDCFVLCIQFQSAASEAEMQSRRYYWSTAARESIWSVYGLHTREECCPFFSNQDMFPSYVRHLLESPQGAGGSPPPARSISLTIARRKALLTALEQRDLPGLEGEIRGALLGAEERSDLLLVAKELLEIAAGAVREYGGDLDFITRRKDLYSWIGSKNRQELADRLCGLYRQLLHQAGEPGKTYSRTVAAAVEYLETNCGNPVGLREAAEHLGVNSSYLSRRFHQETGATVVEYLNRVRTARARADIRAGYPLKEVAARCGFSNYNYFIKVFKEQEGITPGELARKHHTN